MWTQARPYDLNASVFELKSSALDDTLRITVATPVLYEAIQNKLPTLYVLDGDLMLPIASMIARMLELMAFGAMPQLLCVGVGHATEDFFEAMYLRTRDLTPTEGAFPAGAPFPMDKYGTGGAPRLLEALVGEVFPFVEERYRSDPDDRCLVGDSFAGLFGLYSLFNRPEAFRRYLLVSPSIWWDDQAVIRDEEKYAAAHDDLKADVFVCVGDLEESAASRMWPPALSAGDPSVAGMVTNLDALVGRLRSRRFAGLELEHRVFADEHHVTLFPAAFTAGIRSLYG